MEALIKGLFAPWPRQAHSGNRSNMLNILPFPEIAFLARKQKSELISASLYILDRPAVVLYRKQYDIIGIRPGLPKGVRMAHIGLSELLVVFCVVVVLFGYKKLPDLGRNIGRGLRNFKRSLDEPDEIDVTPPAANADKKENRPE